MKKMSKKPLFIISGIFLFLFSLFAFSFDAISEYFNGGGAQVSSLQKGLIAHYPLDGEHQAKDVTPYNNHGTNYGATLSTGVKGESNGSYSFDGVDDYIQSIKEYPELSGIPSISVSMWADIDTSISDYNLLSFKRTGVNNTALNILGRYNIFKVSARTTANAYIEYGNIKIPSGFNYWTSIIEYDNKIIKIYLNGQLVETISDIDMNDLSLDMENLFLGKQSFGSFYAKCSMSDVRIYNRALSDTEIKLLYDSYKPKISTSSLEKGLVGHWMLDSENGAKDLTPNGNHGTVNGGITIGGTTDRKWRSGGATSFDGVDDYVRVEQTLTTNMSVSGWVKFDSYSKKLNTFINGYPHRTLDISLNRTGIGDIYVYIGNGSSWLGTPAIISNINMIVNTWYHITFTSNGTQSNLYINGANVGSSSYVPSGFGSYFDIGKLSNNSTELFDGSISDTRVYNRALSEDEIKLLYDQYKPKEASIGSLQKGLVLDMPLTTKHTKSATIVADRTPYGNDGTVSGATVGGDGTSFDGVNDKISLGNIPNLLSLDKISFNSWVKLNRYKRGMIVGITWPGNWYFEVSSDGKVDLCIKYDNSQFNLYSAESLLLNNWYNITGTYDGVTMKTYINGELSSSYLLNKPIKKYSNSIIYLGDLQSGYPFLGLLSNVRIYNRALSADEVKLLWEKGRY